MHSHTPIRRRLRIAALLAILCAWFALPSATPARADESISIGGIKTGFLERNNDKDFTVSVQAGSQVMIGAINTSNSETGTDLEVRVECPGNGAFVAPRDGNNRNKGKSVGGVVYCAPGGTGSQTVQIKIKNQQNETRNYLLFVISTGSWYRPASLSPNPDLQNRRVDRLSSAGVHLYSVAYAANYDSARFLLQYAPTDSTQPDTRLVARFYSPLDGSRTCSTALLRQDAVDQARGTLPTINSCNPLSTTSAGTTSAYLVVINYVGGPGAYCMYLTPNGSTPNPSQIEACPSF